MTDISTGVYQRSDGLWAWRITSDNGNIIATDGGQGYENRTDCEDMFNKIRAGAYREDTE